MTKPMLAEDAVESKIKFPCWAQPKIDGVRGLNLEGTLTGRSLKKHKNIYTTKFYSIPEFKGLDGELAANQECHPDLCRLTSSAVGTIKGEPYTLWWLFDYITDATRNLPYRMRYAALNGFLTGLQSSVQPDPIAFWHLRLVPYVECANLEQLLAAEQVWLDMGYEGVITRDPDGMYKEGRSTVNEGGLLRIKRFIDAEAEVLAIIEGEMNANEAQKNELGMQFRSSHQDNMVPNGMVGAMDCRLLADVRDRDGKVLFKANEIVRVGAGSMTHKDRLRYFQNPELLLHKIIKFKTFPKGVKVKPRFPTFKSLKIESDMP